MPNNAAPQIPKLRAGLPVQGNAIRALLVIMGALAALGITRASADESTVIDLTYDSVMDMVRPEVHAGIVVHHNLHVTISAHDDLAEHRDRSAKQYSDRNAMVQVLGSSGDDSTYASWQVQPDGRLVRTQNDPQSVRTMTVTLLPGGKCRLEVTDQLKPGFTEYAFLRISTHALGYFSSYHVTSTSCAIHPAAQ